MNDYANKLSEGFSARVVKKYFENSVTESIVNHDYEGEIQNTRSKLNILTFDDIEWSNYSGNMGTPDTPQESVGELITDQKKRYYFAIKSLSQFQSWIKDPKSPLLENAGKGLKRIVDQYVLGLWGDVGAGNRVGTNYTTGTVTVDVTTGAVTGSGTTFTSAMVGKGFKATGHTKWYRVKTYSSATSIVIENDSDDDDSAYDGGAIGAGATYIIEANEAVQVSTSNIFSKLVALKTKLDQAEVPAEDRWVVFPADIANLLFENTTASPAVAQAFEQHVKRGMINMLAGFMIFSNEQVAGDSVNGYHVMAGHKSAITHALGFTETGIEDLHGDFGKAYKGLTVYGAKVLDERRSALAELFCKL
jgi:hypothetical protein